MRLILHTPEINTETITTTYSHGEVLYKHIFHLPIKILLKDTQVLKMANWLSIIHALYLFNIEYFDELITNFPLTDDEITFFEKVIYNGMAEFRYVNNIPINTKTRIVAPNIKDAEKPYTSSPKKLCGRLLLNGGGKDGLTSAILLDNVGIDYDLFQIGTGVAQSKVSKILDKKSHVFIRLMDSRRKNQKNTGHKPTSAAIAIAATFSAYLLGKSEVIASNETSANEPNLEINGTSINHQYTKTYDFECDFSALLQNSKIGVKYFSLLRPLHELQIIKVLASKPDYYNSFISCNNGFRKGFWCKKCAKCAFIGLALTAISPALANTVFKTDNVVDSPHLHEHILSLIEPQTIKPLDCVGTLLECQIAAKLIINNETLDISKRLRDALIKNTQTISNATIHIFLSTLQAQHNIPSPEYDNLLQNLAKILE